MPKFIISAEIHIEGTDIRTREDAIQALEIMLGCYEDMDDTDTNITIKSIKKEEL